LVGVGQGLVGDRALDRRVDHVDEAVAVVRLDQPAFRGYLGPEADRLQRAQRPLGVLFLDEEVDVVVDRLAAPRVHGETTGQAERDLAALELGGRAIQGGDEGLMILGNGHVDYVPAASDPNRRSVSRSQAARRRGNSSVSSSVTWSRMSVNSELISGSYSGSESSSRASRRIFASASACSRSSCAASTSPEGTCSRVAG